MSGKKFRIIFLCRYSVFRYLILLLKMRTISCRLVAATLTAALTFSLRFSQEEQIEETCHHSRRNNDRSCQQEHMIVPVVTRAQNKNSNEKRYCGKDERLIDLLVCVMMMMDIHNGLSDYSFCCKILHFAGEYNLHGIKALATIER